MTITNRWILAVSLAVAAGCRHGDSLPSDTPPAEPDARAAEEAADRAELVSPAPHLWQPDIREARLKLSLFLEKTTLRAGEKIRYRLELQNTGGQAVFFSEEESFMKRDDYGSEYNAYLTEPGESEAPLPPAFVLGSLPLTVEERRKRGRSGMRLTLQPGETLISRPDQPAPNRFRDLKTLTILKRPGRHRLRFVYDRAGEAELRTGSDVVEFDVVP